MASKIRLFIKPTTGSERYTVEVEPSLSIGELKEEVAKQAMPAAEQRLIYKGQILKDERTVESYGACGCGLL